MAMKFGMKVQKDIAGMQVKWDDADNWRVLAQRSCAYLSLKRTILFTVFEVKAAARIINENQHEGQM